jgi:hypothetical protein
MDSIGRQTRTIHKGWAYLFDGVDDYVALATYLPAVTRPYVTFLS